MNMSSGSSTEEPNRDGTCSTPSSTAALVPVAWSGGPPVSAGGWAEDGAGDVPRSRSGLSAYLHAARRRWPAALFTGLLCGAAAVLAAFFLTVPEYTATSLLRISAGGNQLVFQTADQSSPDASFDLYKNTQQVLLTSDMVLIAALRKPDVATLELVRREEDPVRWLAKDLKTDFQNNAEILRVRLTARDPKGGKEVAALVAAVTDAYLNEVVDGDRTRRQRRLSEIDRVYGEKEAELRGSGPI